MCDDRDVDVNLLENNTRLENANTGLIRRVQNLES
jgi:hypothetical protein